MAKKAQIDYALSKLESLAKRGNIDSYTLMENPETGNLKVSLSFEFNPDELCLLILRLTPPNREGTVEVQQLSA